MNIKKESVSWMQLTVCLKKAPLFNDHNLNYMIHLFTLQEYVMATYQYNIGLYKENHEICLHIYNVTKNLCN